MMEYSTQIDTIGLQIDCINVDIQRGILDGLLNFIKEFNSVYIDSKEYILSNINTSRVEHFIYVNSRAIATINTGYFRAGNYINGYKDNYYISIKFAGLKSYNDIYDKSSLSYLFIICSFLNNNNILFKLTELDVCIDAMCGFEHILAVCTKKSPKTHYYGLNEPQVYDTTTYIEKISTKKLKKAVLRAYVYDKSHKEELDYHLTRFELKLQPKYFNSYGFNISIIEKALNRYYVMYFEDINEKYLKIDKYNSYSSVKKREIQRLRFDDYRLMPDIDYINMFLYHLQYVNYQTINNLLWYIENRDLAEYNFFYNNPFNMIIDIK